jgi:plasmid stabilization system protein ParE
LKRIREFIAIHNPSTAARIAAELIGKIELLPNFPKLGVPVEVAPVPESVRDIVFGKSVVRYSVHASAIIVLRIWHGLEGER